MDIPPEIVSLILEEACTDLDPASISSVLRSCSLVSHQWQALSQPLLLSEFTRHKPYYSSDQLIETLREYPHFIPLVKCLWIDKHLFSIPTDVEFLLEVLPHVQQLAIFSNLTRHLRASFMDKALPGMAPTLGNVTFLCLSGLVEVSVETFNHFTALQRLCIRRCTFILPNQSQAEIPVSNTNSMVTRPRLVEITIEGSLWEELEVIRWFLNPRCAFDLSNLKCFIGNNLSKLVDQYNLIERFVEQCASTLEDVLLCPADDMVNIPEELQESTCGLAEHLTHVRVLRLSTCQWPALGMSSIPWIVTFISRLPRPDLLEYLYLPMMFLGRTEYGEENPDRDHWRRMDEMFASGVYFPNFKGIWISIAKLALPHESRTHLVDMLPRLIPRLSEKGMVWVTMSNGVGYMSDRERWTHKRDD